MAKFLPSLKSMLLFPRSAERKQCFIKLKYRSGTICDPERIKIEINTPEKLRRLPKSLAEVYECEVGCSVTGMMKTVRCC